MLLAGQLSLDEVEEPSHQLAADVHVAARGLEGPLESGPGPGPLQDLGHRGDAARGCVVLEAAGHVRNKGGQAALEHLQVRAARAPCSGRRFEQLVHNLVGE